MLKSTFTVYFSQLASVTSPNSEIIISQLEMCNSCKDIIQELIIYNVFQTEKKNLNVVEIAENNDRGSS